MMSRKLILERAGHTVIMANSEGEVTAACEKKQFDVAVLSQTLPPEMKKAVAALIRSRSPSAKILELYAPHIGMILKDADSWLEVPIDLPAGLPERVNELAQKTKS